MKLTEIDQLVKVEIIPNLELYFTPNLNVKLHLLFNDTRLAYLKYFRTIVPKIEQLDFDENQVKKYIMVTGISQQMPIGIYGFLVVFGLGLVVNGTITCSSSRISIYNQYQMKISPDANSTAKLFLV